jgi:myo-inositol-1-phosphate synthase
MSENGKVRVAIIGVGNCASALVQGVNYYEDTDEADRVPGVMHVNLGGFNVGPSDYVPWLTDRKFCCIQMEGTTFGDVPLKLEAKLEVWDSPNSAGVIIDAVRCAKLALDRGISGPLIGPSSYFMKTPPQQIKDDKALEMTEEFIRGEGESD